MAEKRLYVDIDAKESMAIGGGAAAATYPARLYIKGSGSTNSTYGLQIVNSASVLSLQVDDIGNVWNKGPGAQVQNTAFGFEALLTATGNNNTAYGYRAGKAITTASNSTLIGRLAGTLLTTGIQNTAIGAFTIPVATTLQRSVIIGASSMQSMVAGRDNVGIGLGSFPIMTSATESQVSYNVGVGSSVGVSMVTGTENVFLGNSCGVNISAGSGNTCLGYAAGALTAGTYDNSIAIGRNAKITADNQLAIGDQSGGANINEVVWGSGSNQTNINPTTHIHKITSITTGAAADRDAAYQWVWQDAASTGNVDSSGYKWQVAPAGASSSVTNTHVDALVISGDGSLDFSQYGSGTFTGTAAYTLAVDATGNVIETNAGFKYAGDSVFVAATPLTITHNLNSTDILIQFKNASGQFIQPDTIENYTANTVDVTFATAGTYRVIAS